VKESRERERRALVFRRRRKVTSGRTERTGRPRSQAHPAPLRVRAPSRWRGAEQGPTASSWELVRTHPHRATTTPPGEDLVEPDGNYHRGHKTTSLHRIESRVRLFRRGRPSQRFRAVVTLAGEVLLMTTPPPGPDGYNPMEHDGHAWPSSIGELPFFIFNFTIHPPPPQPPARPTLAPIPQARASQPIGGHTRNSLPQERHRLPYP